MAGKLRAKQLADGEITNAKIHATAGIELSKLAEAVLQADGGQALTNNLPCGTYKLTNLGAGTDPNDSVRKAQLDAAIAGLEWQAPVKLAQYIGTRTIAQIDLLTPASGDTVVAGDAGTPTAGTSDALVAGDVAEFDGTSWQKIIAAVGGFVPIGTRLLIACAVTLYAPLVDGTDEGKIAAFDGTSLTPSAKTTPLDGWAVMVDGETSVLENTGWVFDGAVPTGVWIQFTGIGTLIAGDGLDKSGNTVFIKPDGTSTAVSGTGLKAAVPVASNKNMTASVTVNDGDVACATAMASTPGGDSMVHVLVNGVQANLQDDKLGDCFFSSDGGTNAKTIANIASGDLLYWVGSVAGYQLDAADKVSFNYNVA